MARARVIRPDDVKKPLRVAPKGRLLAADPHRLRILVVVGLFVLGFVQSS